MCLHLHEVLEQVKLIYGGKENQNSSCLEKARRVGTDWVGVRISGVIEMFYILMGFRVTQIYTVCKTHRMMHLRFEHFNVCKFYL